MERVPQLAVYDRVLIVQAPRLEIVVYHPANMDDASNAVIAMRDAEGEWASAQFAMKQEPQDPEASSREKDAKVRYEHLRRHVVPAAMRSMPIPVRRLCVGLCHEGRAEIEVLEVVIEHRVFPPQVLRPEARQRALEWLRVHGHADAADSLSGPFSSKQKAQKCWRQVLSAFVESKLYEGVKLDLGVLGVDVLTRARILK